MILTSDYLLEQDFIEADVLVVFGDDVRAFVKILPFEGSITVYIRSEIIKGISSGVRLLDCDGTHYIINSLNVDEINNKLEELNWKYRI